MGKKDVVSKDILKRIALDIARVLLHLKVDSAKVLETHHQRVEERCSDVVVLVSGADGEFILHLEVQNNNDGHMPYRMLRYWVDIAMQYPGKVIRQYVIYIGHPALTMADGIEESDLSYKYNLIDMHEVDCHLLLEQDIPDALVLAILCDFKGHSEREVIRYILHRIRELLADNEIGYRNYIEMLELLSTNRKLEKLVEEEEKMLSQVEQQRLPSFRIGMRYGLEQGLEQGEVRGRVEGQVKMLRRLLEHRFGVLPVWVNAVLQKASEEELERWSDRVLTATTLEEVFGE